MQLDFDDLNSIHYICRVLDPRSSAISNELLLKVLTGWPMDFVVNLEGYPPFPDANHLDLEDEELIPHYQNHGDILNLENPFIWKYENPNAFIQIKGAFLLREHMAFARWKNKEPQAFLPALKAYIPDNQPWTCDREFTPKQRSDLLARWLDQSHYLLTTYMDWVGLMFLTSNKSTLNQFKLEMKKNGFQVDQP